VPLLERLILDHGRRLVLFGVIGVFGVGVNMSLLFLLGGVVGMNHLIAAAIASEVSILGNFFLNDRFTFSDARPTISWLRRMVQYNGVTAWGMVLQLGILATLTLSVGIHYLIANLVGIAAATVSNYVLNTLFTFGLPEKRDLVPLAAPAVAD
jgi:dolichol-phosphate mannosyltransferase